MNSTDRSKRILILLVILVGFAAIDFSAGTRFSIGFISAVVLLTLTGRMTDIFEWGERRSEDASQFSRGVSSGALTEHRKSEVKEGSLSGIRNESITTKRDYSKVEGMTVSRSRDNVEITINGTTYASNGETPSITLKDGVVYLDGVPHPDLSVSSMNTVQLAITVKGDLTSLVTQGRVEVQGDVHGSVRTQGRVGVGGNVHGSVDTQGRVTVEGSVQGDIDTMGKVIIKSRGK